MLLRALVPMILAAGLSMAMSAAVRPSPGTAVASARHAPDSLRESLVRLLPRMSPSRLYRP